MGRQAITNKDIKRIERQMLSPHDATYRRIKNVQSRVKQSGSRGRGRSLVVNAVSLPNWAVQERGTGAHSASPLDPHRRGSSKRAFCAMQGWVGLDNAENSDSGPVLKAAPV